MDNQKNLTIKKYVSSLDSIARSDAKKTLGRVLAMVKSSHEAVFIFNEDDIFVGLVSPYKTLYSSRLPHATKVSSVVFTPPAITKESPVYRVADHMLATKMYSLPVFNKEGRIDGVVHGKDILKSIAKDRSLLDFISRKIKIRKPLTMPATSLVKDVFHVIRDKGVSRMILVDENKSLAGIVSRSDLMHTLIKPTPKMRFPNEGSAMGRYSLAGEKDFRKNEPITKYCTEFIKFLPNASSESEIVKYLISSDHNSVVLVDANNKPTGFLSIRDVLKAVTFLRPEEYMPLVFKRPGSSVGRDELDQVIEHLELFGKKLSKRMDVKRIEVGSQESKSAEGQTGIFSITLMVTPVSGKSFVSTVKHRKYINGIQEATKTIEKQIRRSES